MVGGYDKSGDKNPKWRGGPIKFLCAGCGAESHYNRGKKIKKFCTIICYWGYKQKTKPVFSCYVCGKNVHRNAVHAARSSKIYCSRACFGIDEKGAANHAYRGGLAKKSCVVCGSEMLMKKSEIKKTSTCSKACRSLNRSRIRSKPRVIKECVECKIEMRLIPAIQHTRKFCSKKCKDENHSKKMSGSGNGRYVHGEAYLPYLLGWTKTHRATIRERDGHKCMVCGSDKGKRKHDVHHINYIKEDISPDNLITLCRQCHGGSHGNLESRKICRERLSNLLKK